MSGVSRDRDLRQKMAYGNHRSMQKCEVEVHRKAMSGVVGGRAMVFKGTGRVAHRLITYFTSGEMEENEKYR